MTETIYAFASGAGKAGVSVLRISGPDALAVAAAFGAEGLVPRMASLRSLKGKDGILDKALVLYFEAGSSFTGEETVEFQVHGSLAVRRALTAELDQLELVREAEAGEFTRRALLNGRMDLTEVQGLGDLIEAETEEQRRAAMRVMSGEMSAKLQTWRRDLVRAQALLEATIDFADEEVPEDVWPEVSGLLSGLKRELERELAGVGAAKSLRDGFTVALVGAPNVGKSSLLNALAKRQAAIVSDIAGTTRDVLEIRLDIKGLPVTLLDMAGIRETSDHIEALGVARARDWAEEADLRVFLVEGEDERTVFPMQQDDIVIRTKVDIHGGDGVSSISGEGLSKLVDAMYDRLAARVAGAGLTSRKNDAAALERALSGISDVFNRRNDDVALLAEILRESARELARLIGEVGVEDILDDVFASFCLGK